MSKLAIGSLFGGILCLGLSIAPIPFQKYVMLRCAGGVGAISFFTIGHWEAERQKKLQAEKARFLKIEKQRQQEFDDLERRNREAIEAGKREALLIEARQKEEVRIKLAIADYTDDVRDAYVAVQDGKGRLDRVMARFQPEPEPEQVALPEPELAVITEEIKASKESFAAKKAKLLKFLKEHEGGWILQCMQKPILIYGDMGAFKSYFAEFLALCRVYLKGHQIISIADPHFHQNKDESWKNLIKLGVSGYGANHNYFAIGEQLNAMYDRFTKRTLKDIPFTSIWDEVTNYSAEQETIEPSKKLVRKIVSDPRKANESPILIGHDNTLIALGAGEGFSKARDRGIIQLELYSDSDNRPLFKGKISGIKNAEGEFVEAQKISIAPGWIRPDWVYDLFNSDSETIVEIVTETIVTDSQAPEIPTETNPGIDPKQAQASTTANKAEFLDQARKWLDDVYEAEAEVTSPAPPWDEAPEVISEVPEVQYSSTFAITSLLPEDIRSKALTRILTLLGEAGSASDEVINLMSTNPERAIWIGIKILGKSMTATSRDIFGMGTGGKKFRVAKGWYESLKKGFDDA